MHPSHIPQSFDFNQQIYMIIWESTRACALTCRHCRASSQRRADGCELNHQEALSLIDQVARANPQLFIITGGDPMCRTDLHDLIQYAVSKKLRVALSPSATPRLLRSDFKRLYDLGITRMSLSLDGADATTHNHFRGVLKAWDWTMKAAEKAAEAGIRLQINTTISRWNYKQLERMAEVIQPLNPFAWTLFFLVPTGRGRHEDLLTAHEVEDVMNQAFDLNEHLPFPIKTTEGQHYRRLYLQRKGLPISAHAEHGMIGLNDGRGFTFISHKGEICPSGFLPIVAGNVKTDELIDVYRNDPSFKQLRDASNFKGKCSYCEYNGICGGSRARAYAMTGDYLASEPLCVYQPKRKSEVLAS